MQLPDFKLERYFARWEFSAPYLLCSSDIEGWRLPDLLALADADARDRWERLSLGYTESPGLPSLREEIAALYPGLTPGQVLCFAGAEEALLASFNALLSPGDHVVATWPGYQSLHTLAQAAGAEVTPLRLREEDGWQLDLAALEAALRPNTRLVVVNFPHNPTGALPDEKTFRALVALLDERGVRLFSDEVYRFLEYDDAARLPTAAELSASAVSLGVMSKAYGLAGLRIGWLACRDSGVLKRAAAWKDYGSICNSAPSEILALIALRARARVLLRSREILRRNLAVADAFFLRQAARVRWVRPRAGSVAFPRLVRDRSIRAFTESLVTSRGVLLLPGDVYDVAAPHFRLGLGRSNFPEALKLLEAELATD